MPRRGERLVVLAERSLPAVRADDEEIIEDLRRAVLRETGLRPERVALFSPGDLPRTSSGKHRRQAAAEQYFSNRLPEE